MYMPSWRHFKSSPLDEPLDRYTLNMSVSIFERMNDAEKNHERRDERQLLIDVRYLP
jgi:hypothetical protein